MVDYELDLVVTEEQKEPVSHEVYDATEGSDDESLEELAAQREQYKDFRYNRQEL